MYTIKRLKTAVTTNEDLAYLALCAARLNAKFGGKYKWTDFKVFEFMDSNYLALCYQDKVPVGMMAASFYESFFDPSVIILQQNTLFTEPGTRALSYLYRDFIDFGKGRANHIITMLAGSQTNIKPRSLERLGFTKLEELYRLEV